MVEISEEICICTGYRVRANHRCVEVVSLLILLYGFPEKSMRIHRKKRLKKKDFIIDRTNDGSAEYPIIRCKRPFVCFG